MSSSRAPNSVSGSLAGVSPAEVAAGLRHLPGLVFLDSSTADEPGQPGRVRYSIVTALPERTVTGNIGADEGVLREALCAMVPSARAGVDVGAPAAGLYGCVGYDGDFVFGEYRSLLVFDHLAQRWSVSGDGDILGLVRWDAGSAPEWKSPGPRLEFETQMGQEDFVRRVRAAQEYIAAGDIYQVNLSRKFVAGGCRSVDPFGFYRKLREISPAPFSAYLDLGDRKVLSTSPEPVSYTHLTLPTKIV